MAAVPRTLFDADGALIIALSDGFARLGDDQVTQIVPASASEDFSWFARTWNVPAVYWAVGGTAPQLYDRLQREGRANEIPSNHSPQFAPVITPTLGRGIEAMLAAASPWLAP